jgi:hypothetical protein
MRSAAIAEFSNTAAVAEVSEIGREVPAGADASIQTMLTIMRPNR